MGANLSATVLPDSPNAPVSETGEETDFEKVEQLDNEPSQREISVNSAHLKEENVKEPQEHKNETENPHSTYIRSLEERIHLLGVENSEKQMQINSLQYELFIQKRDADATHRMLKNLRKKLGTSESEESKNDEVPKLLEKIQELERVLEEERVQTAEMLEMKISDSDIQVLHEHLETTNYKMNLAKRDKKIRRLTDQVTDLEYELAHGAPPTRPTVTADAQLAKAKKDLEAASEEVVTMLEAHELALSQQELTFETEKRELEVQIKEGKKTIAELKKKLKAKEQ